MKILLHACCGPCSLEPTRLLLEQGHELAIYYQNSNIEPLGEYQHRLKTLLDWAKDESIPVIEADYDHDAWAEAISKAWKPGDEQSLRCRACYAMRFEDSVRYAHDHGFEALGTTLSVSPHQFTRIIGEELERACAPYDDVQALFQDYRGYYDAGRERSRELEMYRQDYCGCAYSKAEADQYRAESKARRAEAKKNRKPKPQLKTDDFAYDLPEEKIAQEPAAIRDACKLLVMDRETGEIEDKVFHDIIDYLNPGDLLVVNETRVRPARLLGAKRETGGQAEVFLLRERFDLSAGDAQGAVWEALVRPGRRLKPGAVVQFQGADGQVALEAEVLDWLEEAEKGERLVRLTTALPSLDEALHAVGHTPLPPYIKNYAGDEELYQTVYSREERSAAAPTAGLHFTPALIERIKAKGVGFETVHLEVGLDTFRVVDENDPRQHKMHTERYSVPVETAWAIEDTKAAGGRVIAVGTTSVRSLESAWHREGRCVIPRIEEPTSLFILPGYEFKVVDALITNFHVPRSTLMMLVSAFSTRENIMAAYQHALDNDYRLLSFGDAMFIH